MADNPRLNKILLHAEDLGLAAQKFDWGKNLMGGLTDYRVKTSLFGEDVWGIGIDSNEELAFLKAFSESIERSFCKKLGMSSNGISAHWDEVDARKNSINELIERDIFLCHYLTGKPGKRISNDLIIKINENISTLSCRIKVYELTTLNDVHVFFTLGEKGMLGNIIGLGAHTDVCIALKKSIIECLFRLLANTQAPIKIDEEALMKPIDHFNFHMENTALRETKFIDQSSFSTPITQSKLNLNIEWKTIGDLSQHFENINIKIIQASSKNLQSLFYGKTNLKKINQPRIEDFMNNQFVFNHLENLPHPIG